jgi:lipoate-protein ligase B
MSQGAQTKTCQVVELGRISYGEAAALQERLVTERKAGGVPDVLLLCEHPHVVTLGRNGKPEHLRASDSQLRQMGVEFHGSKRGGDITYHGPGQMVAYPILNLGEIRRDVVWYVRKLEEAMIRATAAFGVAAVRVAGCTGVWVEAGDEPMGGSGSRRPKEKLGAIGVHISRWVTSHGLAYNVSTDLRYFDLIVPCGIADCRTTSLEKLLSRRVSTAEFAPALVAGLGEALGLEMIRAPREELDHRLAAAHAPAGAASRP